LAEGHSRLSNMDDIAHIEEPLCLRESRKRVRIHFDAAVNPCGSESAHFARRLLIALPPGLRVVADLIHALRCRLPTLPPRELCVSIDGFTLPLEQHLNDIVRDDDVLTVRESSRSATASAAWAAAAAAAIAPVVANEVAPASQAEELVAEGQNGAEEPVASPPARKRRKISGGGSQSPINGPSNGSAVCGSRGESAAALNGTFGRGGQTSLISSAEASHAARKVLALEGLDAAPSPIDELAARKAAALAEVEAALAGAQAAAKAKIGSEATEATACHTGPADMGGNGQLKDEDGQSSQYKVFLGGLPWSCDESILRRDFEECGKIASLRLLTDRETGRSRGMAFITFNDAAGLEAALKYNGDTYGGRTLTVAKAEGKGGSGKGKGADGGKGKGKAALGGAKGGPSPKPAGCTSVVVKGLAYEATEDDLRRAFRTCGRGPANVRILTDRATGEPRGVAFVDFDGEGAAVDEAVKMSGTELRGRVFFVDYARPRQ